MGNLEMSENDYETLKKLENAFETKDLSYFKSFLENSRSLPLLLRVHSVCMLEHIGDEQVVEPLCHVLKHDSSPLTRHEAAFTLGQLGFRTAVPALVESMLHDQSPIVRHESAVALSSIGDPSIIPQLKQAISDSDEDVRNSALIAFEYLSYLERKRTDDDSVVKPKIRL
ncbi:MAG TPA: HEAT repeat domain-containing protein [Terriglobales bacterium]|nr:HEAT repeat domain-containing protein [Terriglobales bacterium]